jgi:tellurite resistance protein TerA
MGLFDFKKNETAAASTSGVDLGKKTGTISLTKGERVTIDKTPVIRARATWSSNTDYDLYALVLLKDGTELVVSTFGSEAQPTPTPSVLNGAVRHLGDVGRTNSGKAEEVIEIKMTDDIVSVVPIAYSAQSNGTGSFRKYKVSLSIDNGAGADVNIDAASASMNPIIYSLAIGAIRNTTEGVVIEHLEKYSKSGSELRPTFVNGEIAMNAGSKNLYK